MALTYPKKVVLFNNGKLSDWISSKLSELSGEIKQLQQSDFIEKSIEELCDFFEKKYQPKVPQLQEKKIEVKDQEVKINISNDFNRVVFDRSKPTYVSGTAYIFFIPFEGDKILFNLKPSQFDFTLPHGTVDDNTLYITIQGIDLPDNQIKENFNSELGKVKKYLGWTENDITPLNTTLRLSIKSQLETRKAKLIGDKSLVSSLGFPIRQDKPVTPQPKVLAIIDTNEGVKEMSQTPSKQKVFIVHGQDELAKLSLARFIENLGLEAIILHEQANAGKTLIEKLEAHVGVDYAVILLTPDDTGGIKGTTLENLQPRARQNVILELGLFFGILGRTKVCALYKDKLELPSDIHGLVYIRMDEENAWERKLAKEFRAAGLNFDATRLI